MATNYQQPPYAPGYSQAGAYGSMGGVYQQNVGPPTNSPHQPYQQSVMTIS